MDDCSMTLQRKVTLQWKYIGLSRERVVRTRISSCGAREQGENKEKRSS